MHHRKPGWAAYMLLIFLAGLAAASALMLIGQAVWPTPIQFAGMTIDRLSAAMTLLVAGIGAVTYRFALRYLDGEPRHNQFLAWLGATIGCAYVLMLATNLGLLFVAWSFTSLGLHQLLTFYHERREAERPARKKFLISRLGDVALLSAIGLIWATWRTLDLAAVLGYAKQAGEAAPALTAVALLIVIAALTKSAQFPFHSWLPETMEAPTPVSALMHAGIINAGGVLLLRFAPLLVQVPSALFLLALIGTLTMTVGMLAMWAQPDVKRTLAWSTVSQMGFMVIQCGLAAFPAAALHIVGHGCYKAWSFLRTGTLPQKPQAAPIAPQHALLLSTLGTLLAIPVLALAARVTGFEPTRTPGELALSAIVALSIGQMWIALFRSVQRNNFPVRVLLAVLLTFAAGMLAFGAYHAMEIFLAPVLGELTAPASPLIWAAVILPVLALIALNTVHTLLPLLSRTSAGRAFHVHALHGFYLGTIANQIVDRIWMPSRRIDHA